MYSLSPSGKRSGVGSELRDARIAQFFGANMGAIPQFSPPAPEPGRRTQRTVKLQSVDPRDWKEVQQALNAKLKALRMPRLVVDGKLACGRGRRDPAHFVGGTWNAIVWWLGPAGFESILRKYKGKDAVKMVRAAIQAKRSPALAEVYDPDQVAALQDKLGLKLDGCFGASTATAVEQRVSSWAELTMEEVLRKVRAPETPKRPPIGIFMATDKPTEKEISKTGITDAIRETSKEDPEAGQTMAKEAAESGQLSPEEAQAATHAQPGLSRGVKIAIGVGALALAGGVAWALLGRKKGRPASDSGLGGIRYTDVATSLLTPPDEIDEEEDAEEDDGFE